MIDSFILPFLGPILIPNMLLFPGIIIYFQELKVLNFKIILSAQGKSKVPSKLREIGFKVYDQEISEVLNKKLSVLDLEEPLIQTFQ